MYVEVGHQSLLKHGEELCGDTVEVVRTENCTIMVMTDGLGSGVKANILSTLTAKILATMLSDGATLEETVETVASTLPMDNVRGVAYSTFTVLKIFRDGKAHLIEFDNPALVCLGKNGVKTLMKDKKTIGDKEIYESYFTVEDGDVCVLFSDGVVHAGVGQSLALGWQHKNVTTFIKETYAIKQSAFFMTKEILRHCNLLYKQKAGDDTTVITAAVREEEQCTIMVGPPIEDGMDRRLVKRLMETKGKKIVCGGTTATIVSRILNQSITVDMTYLTPEIPPTGKIKGIDLVTEGVITLGHTCRYLKAYVDIHPMEEQTQQEQENAATILAKMLLESCSDITFFVGQAVNPAHQGRGAVLNLSRKLSVIAEIGSILKGLGKEVNMEYF